MNIDKRLKELLMVEVEKPESILSVYLNTDPSDPDQQNGEWKIELKNGLNSFENYLKQNNDTVELKNFYRVRKEVENYVENNQLDFKKSVVIFISSDLSIWFAETLHMNVKTELHWRESPVMDQLYQIKSIFPKVGVILVQQEQVKVIEAELGKILESRVYQLDTQYEVWREFSSFRQANVAMEKDMNSVKVESKANKKRWYKSLAPKLDKLALRHHWKKTYLVGSKQELKELANFIDQPISGMKNKNMLDHHEALVIEAIIA